MNRAGVAAIAASGTATIMTVIAMVMGHVEPDEGRVHSTYIAPEGNPTACVGNRSAAVPGAKFTDLECDLLLISDSIPAVIIVDKLTAGLEKTNAEWAAMASFVFNVGWTAFAESTLLQKFRAGDRDGAMAEFSRWICGNDTRSDRVRAAEISRMIEDGTITHCEQARGRKRVFTGLVTRRARDAALFGEGFG